MVFDAGPFLLALSPVTVGVNDQQDKQNCPRGDQHDEHGLPVPDLRHEVGKIGRHAESTYTVSGKCQMAG